MNNSFNITQVNWKNAQHALSMLRTIVFMDEQNVSAEDEWDNKDESATHFLVCNTEGDAIGCARVLTESITETFKETFTEIFTGTCKEAPCYHIGRVAVLKAYRNQGIGHQLMQTIIAWCNTQNSASKIYLHAQTERITFYQHLNFVAQDDIFMDAGIPHIEMWHKLIE